MANLATAAINLSALREYGRKELLQVLDSVQGKKGLVLDQKLAGPLSLIAEYSLLKEHGVEKVYILQSGKLDTELKNLIYICRPRMIYMKYISDHIHQHKKENLKKDYSVFFVPRRTIICEKILEEEGVYGEIQLGEYNLDLIPFDDDLLSLELEYSFRELYLEGDRTSLFYVARSLMKLQTIFGVIPRIQGKGQCARLVTDMMLRMRREVGGEDNSSLYVASEIENLIIIDRNVDLITPLCSQLTYEGLIDEHFCIQNTCVELDPEITGFKERRKIPLNSADSIFRELRDCNFSVVGPLLNKSAKRINAEYEERHNAKTVSQIRDFIGKLGSIQTEHQSLRIHTNVAEKIMEMTKDPDFHKRLEVEQNLVSGIEASMNIEYIEELIDKQEPLVKVLRLLCLLSLVSNGLKPKVLENIKREILQTYGYEQIFSLNNLEKLGLLKKNDNKSNYNAVRKGLRLIVDDVNEREPEDIAYVYSGYAPISVRLIQYLMAPFNNSSMGGGASNPNVNMGGSNTAGAPTGGMTASSSIPSSSAPFNINVPLPANIKLDINLNPAKLVGQSMLGGWKSVEDVLKVLPGPTFEEQQILPVGLQPKKGFGAENRSKVTLVFFLGGCTFTEISAIRFLGQQAEGRDYIIATTKLINGNTLLESVLENIDNKLVQ